MMDETQIPGGPTDETTTGSSHPSGPSGAIGNYRLLDKIGEGGMGEVYVAEQIRPVRRKVAFKVIKPGMDTRQVVARFEAERQAVAMMDHPCIAKVFDAGATEQGRPYFVMEFVQGIPITEHCDKFKLSTRERLELFIRVCEGVQHAHQKAIIHRDLKPSNVLVTMQDGEPLPKIIDFGVAKATTQPLTDKTMYTEIGQLIGTPEYMSPEQADMSGENIDTRTDVYALGTILYELLVGELPFSPEELRSSGFDEIRRKIREDDPPRPSTRIVGMGELATETASIRKTDPSALTGQLKGDLDWIVMKALEKERTRRYDSPSALAMDVRNFLNDEPVLARPPSTRYRMRKFVRRHRVGVTAAAALLVVLVGFAVTMTVQAGRIARERDRANLEAETAYEVSEFLVGLFEVSDPGEALGNTITAREILDRGAQEIGYELEDQPAVQARLMETMGRVYRNLGLYREARPLLSDALEIQRSNPASDGLDELWTLQQLGNLEVRTGGFEDARTLLEEALARRIERLGPDDPSVALVLNDIGGLHLATGAYEEAQRVYERCLVIREENLGRDDRLVAETLHNLAIVAWRTGDREGALRRSERSLRILEQAQGPDHPDVARALNTHAGLLKRTGDLDAARPLYERSLSIRETILGPDHPLLARTMNDFANFLIQVEDYEAAKSFHERALTIRVESLDYDHPDVADSLNNLALVYQKMGRYDEAQTRYHRALAIREEKLGTDHPKVARSHYNLACLAALQRDRNTALFHLKSAVDRGYSDESILTDADLASLRGDPDFETIVARITPQGG